MSLPSSEIAALHDKAAVSYGAVAATTWLVWDTMIHWDIEAECIWRNSGTSWTRFAYIFMRYATILHEGAVLTLDVGNVTFSDSACRGWLAEQGMYMELLAIVVEIVLIMRLYALYHRNRLVLLSIVVLGVAQVAVMSVAVGVTIARAGFNANCQIVMTPGLFTAYWISSLVFETYLFFLTLVVFLRHFKLEYKRGSIMFVFVRDGTWAYAMIFVSLLLNTLLYKLEKNPLAGMGYFWDCSTLSFCGSHILLNIKRLGIPKYDEGVDTTLPTMQFQSGQEPLNTVLTSVIDASSRFESTMATIEESEPTTLVVASPESSNAYSPSPHPRWAWERDLLGAGPSRLSASAST
ncbi:hypothetical protein NM688_g6443 [Phlebia brevispora]|uniref:Uncharacterized protein n=1 Tax=Phlebia brevispora TaxID=194682 RepID=A0ACC1SG48_9APHY|nr:hypothetical protein NM688_g6443 [Phlebia brevispora]